MAAVSLLRHATSIRMQNTPQSDFLSSVFGPPFFSLLFGAIKCELGSFGRDWIG